MTDTFAERGGRRLAPSVIPSPLAPVAPRASASDLVVASIRAAILEGRLPPGETLVERRLAEQLGVSKTPVREALIALSASGLVTVTPNRGTVVRTPDVGDIRQAYELRVLVEPWAVARTISGDDGSAVAEAGEALDEAAGHLAAADRPRADELPADVRGTDVRGTDGSGLERSAADRTDADGFVSSRVALSLANRRFHRAMYAGCGNSLVVAQLDAVQDLAALGAIVLLWAARPPAPARRRGTADTAADTATDVADGTGRRTGDTATGQAGDTAPRQADHIPPWRADHTAPWRADHTAPWRAEHAEHEQILAAALEGAADRVERLVRRHIRRSVLRLS